VFDVGAVEAIRGWLSWACWRYASGGASADRILGHDSALDAVAPRRLLLDHVPPLGHAHLERGMVEIAAISTAEPRGDRLEDLSVQAYRLTAGTEREPVEVDSGGSRALPSVLSPRSE
jgi:hypothetical protein